MYLNYALFSFVAQYGHKRRNYNNVFFSDTNANFLHCVNGIFKQQEFSQNYEELRELSLLICESRNKACTLRLDIIG
jgi:hypothetical protein